jgi:cbb3-type cytochrome oxidase cytochrome c subunit
LIDPRAVSYCSIMPRYSYLFQGEDGGDLVAYLQSLKNPGSAKLLQSESVAWYPEAQAVAESRVLNGATLFCSALCDLS